MPQFKTLEEKLAEKRLYLESKDFLSRLSQIATDQAYALAHDDDPHNPWIKHNPHLTHKINRFDALGLQLISLVQNEVFDEFYPMSDTIRNFIAKFIENSIGNTNLNQFLSQAELKTNIIWSDKYLTSSGALGALRYFSFKTRNIEKSDKTLNLIENNFSGIYTKPIGLREFAGISDLAKVTEFMDLFKPFDILDSTPKLTALYEKAIKAKSLIDKLEQATFSEFTHTKHSIIILDNSFKKSIIMGWVVNFFEKIKSYFFKFGHSSMHSQDDKGNPQIFHINPEMSYDEMHIERILFSNYYKVNIHKLINPQLLTSLKTIYGDEFEDKLNAQFQAIENSIHSKFYAYAHHFEIAETRDMYLSGISDFIPFGHKQLRRNNFEQIADELLSNIDHRPMLCSEFSANILITAINELNKKIANDMQKAGLQPVKNTIHIPFGEHENLHRVHPDRLLKILKDANCVEKYVPKAIKGVISKKAQLEQISKPISKTVERL